MTRTKVSALTLLTLVGFAGNSLLCRSALTETNIDAASFTTIRITSGALLLYLILKIKNKTVVGKGTWLSALVLVFYAAGFSFAYMNLTAATGSLLLFSAVQITMISHGLWSGERLMKPQYTGLILAIGGLVYFLLPGLSTPPLVGCLFMIGAGISWGMYSLRGKKTVDAVATTAGNFMRATPIAILLSALRYHTVVFDINGVLYAIVSGAVATAMIYVVWYTVVPELKETSAAVSQLAVPVIAALGGIILLGEPITLRYALSAVAILSGISLAIREKQCFIC